MGKLIDPEFAKELIDSCQKIIETLIEAPHPEPEKEKGLGETLEDFYFSCKNGDRGFIQPDIYYREMASVAKKWFLKKAESHKRNTWDAEYVRLDELKKAIE